MLKLLFAVLLLPAIVFSQSQPSSDSEIIYKTKSRVNTINTLKYESHNTFEMQMAPGAIDTITIFFDWKNAASLTDSKYLFIFNKNNTKHLYNGTTLFNVQPEEEKIITTLHPKSGQMCSSMAMLNSMFMAKQILSAYKNDSTIVFNRGNDTIINHEDCYKFNIALRGKALDMNKGFEVIDAPNAQMNYVMAIGKKDYIPQYLMTAFKNGGASSTYTNIEVNKNFPESTWSDNHFPKEYMRISDEDFFNSKKTNISTLVGQAASDWTLPALTGDSVRLSQLKGNVVLLEFWFPYCGGCVQAIPSVDEIAETYKKKGLKVYGIEFQKQEKDKIKAYATKHNIQIPILYNGDAAAKAYSIFGAPTFFLIDQSGTIVYAKIGLNKQELIDEINKNLN